MDDQELLARLLAAVAAGDAVELSALCQANRDQIVARFGMWRRLPEDQRADPAQVRRRAEGMIAVAQVFDQELGDPALLELLVGAVDENPILRWRSAFSNVHGLMQGRRYPEALEALEALAASFEGLSGTAVDHYLPLVQGRLGECLFHLGRFAEARAPTDTALALCEVAGDVNGVIAYLGNLVEIHRRLGEHLLAERYAERRAKLVEELRRPS